MDQTKQTISLLQSKKLQKEQTLARFLEQQRILNDIEQREEQQRLTIAAHQQRILDEINAATAATAAAAVAAALVDNNIKGTASLFDNGIKHKTTFTLLKPRDMATIPPKQEQVWRR